MDQKYNTSFIPKKFLSEDVQSGSTSKYIKRRSIVGPGYFIAVLIFIATVGASVALFAYTRILEGSLNEKIVDLKESMEAVKSEDLTEFLELEKQMKNAKYLLENHVAISEVLHKLEMTTLENVQYVAMAYKGASKEEFSTIDLSGVTKSLADVALQIREYEQDKHIITPTITNLTRDPGGVLIQFDVRASVLRDLISYNIAVREGRHGKNPVRLQARPSLAPAEATSDVTDTSTP
jgi:hypothetical protein